VSRHRLLDGEVGDVLWHWRWQSPRQVSVLVSFGALAGTEPGHAKPGMAGQLHNELLTHHSRSSQHANVKPWCSCCGSHDRVLLLTRRTNERLFDELKAGKKKPANSFMSAGV
jgi:hypothetical protein